MSNRLSPRDERILEVLKTLGPARVNELVEWTGLTKATVHYRLDILLARGLIHRFAVKRDSPGRPCVYWFVEETGVDIFLNWCKKLETESFDQFIKRLDSLPPVLKNRLTSILSMKTRNLLLCTMAPDLENMAKNLTKEQLQKINSLVFWNTF
ncbi:MAG: MarR family transcriptional regulator [Candidatus Odinarchaeota archaeon]